MHDIPRELDFPRRLLIDATFTVASGKNSGIERVVCNILRETRSIRTARKGHFAGLPLPQMLISQGGRFYEVDDVYLEDCRRLGAKHANVLGSTSRLYQSIARLICRSSRLQRLQKWLLPTAGHLGIFKLPHSWESSASRRALAARQRPIEFQADDLLLLPDAYWINRLRSSVWPGARRARKQGAFVATVLYDLIPLTHPQFVGEKRRVAFLDYLLKAASNSDLLLTISKTVRDQVQDFLPTLEYKGSGTLCREVRPFTLGAELRVSTGEVRPHVLAPFDHDTPPYLMVATFDPRKNHQYLLDAFDLLWRERQDVRLCLVGRIGARCDDIVARVRSHPLLGSRLFLFDDLSDAELQHCYRNSRAVVFPSIVEGFGLPIVEALWFGKKTFASDTPIHREVGGEDCVYFSLARPASLVQEIVQWERGLEQAVAGRGAVPTQSARTAVDWQGSTAELLSHCLTLMQQRRVPLQTAAAA